MIEIGCYYRCEKADEIEVRRGRAPSAGELVLVVDIAADRVEFASGGNSWYEDLASFARDYILVADGAGEREREIAALLEAARSAQADSVALSSALSAQTLLASGPDDSVAISTEGAENARLRVADVRNQVARVRQSLSERKARLRALLDEQESAIEAQAKRLEGWLEKANDAIWAINLYLGRDETIVRLSDGAPAEPDEPIVVRQLVLYMDEETAIGAADGGIDATNLAAFDAWVCEPEHLGRVLPERRGVVAFKARRKTRDYGDSFRNAQMAQANQHTYFLIRNGDRLFRIDAAIEVADTLFPTALEFDTLFVAREYDFDRGEYRERRLRPGSVEFMKAHDAATGIERHYMRVALMLQGLLDRTTVFQPLADERVNILDPREHRDRVRFIHDAERTLGDGRPSFRDWLSAINSRLDVGHRVAGAFSSHEARLWDGYNAWRVSPRGAGAPSDDSLHTIVRRDGDHWVVLFDRTSWGEPYGRRATFRLGSDDSFIIDFDLATVDDCRYYLSDRVNRRHYLAMIPLLERVVALKQQESAAEAPFRQLLAGRIATEHGVAVADAEAGLDELVSWWKFKTRTHRALSSDDRSALRMIVAEFGLRRSQAMEIERRAAAGAAVVDAVRQQFPNAILVAHKREAEYVALVAYNDEDVFVAEQTWYVDRRSGQPRLRSEKPWAVVDARSERWRALWASGRWESWPRRLRAREHLTGPEREAALAWALERIAESSGRFRNCLTRFTRARPIVAAFGAKDRLRIWVWTAPARVPKVALLSDDVSTPEVRVVRIEWERTKAGLTFQLDHPSGAMAADSNSLPWNASPSSSGQSRRQPNGAPVRVVWTDAETLAALRGDVARAKEASQRRQALYSLVWKYDRQVGARMHEIAVERAYRAFLDEFHAPDLWEGHLKSLPEISIPHRDRLGRALSLLVERNEPVAGRTVAEVLAAASAIGLEARDGDRDRDGLPLDFRLEPLEPEPVDEDEEAPL